MKNFLAELKRRNVHKGAIVYAVIAWLLIQVAFIPVFEVPSWAIKTLIVLLVLGFVAVVSISWAFEATPEGMKRTEELSPNEVLPTWSRKKFAIFHHHHGAARRGSAGVRLSTKETTDAPAGYDNGPLIANPD